MYSLLAGYAADAFEPYAIWITVGIFGALLIGGIILSLIKKDAVKPFLKIALVAFTVYALIIGIVMLILEIIKHYDPAYLEENYVSKDIIKYVFLPVLITLILSLIGGTISFIVMKRKPQAAKKTLASAGVICGFSLIASIVMMALYFSDNIAGDGYYTEGYGNLNSVALYVFAAVLVITAVLAALIIGRKDKTPFDTRCIAFAGITIALSFTLSYVKLWSMPQGGTVTLASMLPVMIFAYVYGPKKGVLIGLIYGVLQAVQDPYIVHPAQFLLDYPVAFSMAGFAGALKYTNVFGKLPQVRFAISAVIGAVLRFISHVLSGVFAFGAYAKDAGANSVLLYSLAYNSFVFVDIALVIAVGVILFSSKAFNIELDRLNPPLYKED